MTPNRGIGALFTAALLAVIVGSIPCRAAVTFDLSLGAGVERNDNLYLVPDAPQPGQAGPIKSTIVTYSPAANLAWAQGQDALRLDYLGIHQDFHGDGQSPSIWIHKIDAGLQWRRWEPFFLEATETRARVPRYSGSRDVDLLVNVDRNNLSVRPGLDWEVGRTSRVQTAVRWEQQSFPGLRDADTVTGLHGEVRVTRRWTPLMSSSLNLDLGSVRSRLAADYREARVTLGTSQRLSPLVAANYALEWRRDWYSRDESSATPPPQNGSLLLGRVALSGTFERGLSWSLAYRDRLEDLLDGERLKAGQATGDVQVRSRLGNLLSLGAMYEKRDFRVSGREEQAWGPRASARWLLTDWAALDVSGTWTRTRVQLPVVPPGVNKQLSLSAGLALLLGRHVQLEAGYRHLKTDSTAAADDYRSNRYYALCTLYLEPFRPGQFPPSSAGRLTPSPPGGGAPQGAQSVLQ